MDGVDRHLLFAVVAMQEDLITRAQLDDICTEWSRRRDVPLARLLLEKGWISDEDSREVERKLRQKLEGHRGDVRATLGAVAGAGALEALRTVDIPEVRETLGSLPEADGSAPGEPPAPADPRRSRYTLTRVHAEGGLGRVWMARDNDLNREVALKEIKSEQADHPEAWRRFLKEAQVAGQLEHPNIVPVYELARRPGDDRPFYTMRFVRGRTLREAIAEYHERRQGGKADPLELPKLLHAFVNVCQAIAYAHSRGVIHRDLKPDNVVLGEFGEVLVLDWGLAKRIDQPDEEEDEHPTLSLSDDAQTVATRMGQQLGTPAYMAPEQAEGRLDMIDARTDIYGLGAILYEVLAGRPPHEGGSVLELLSKVATGETPRARSADPSIPNALDAICGKAMAKSRDDRYARAADLAEDVQRWLADEPVSAAREGVRARLRRWSRRHRGLVQVAASSFLLVTLGAVIVAVQQASSADRLRWEEFRTRAALAAEKANRQEAVLQRREAERQRRNAEDAQAATQAALAESRRQTELAKSRLYFIHMNLVQRSWEDYNPELFRQFLDEQLPTKQGGVDRRGFEWYYWERKFASGHRTLEGHADKVTSVAFSPDGKHVASGSDDRTVRVWDVAAGGPALTLKGHAAKVTGVAYSPDGKRLASASGDRTVKVWDVATGREVLSLKGHTHVLSSVAFSPDGTRLASASEDRTVKVWDATTGRELLTLKGHTNGVTSVAYSPDGKRLASASDDHTVRVWDAATGQEALTLEGHALGVTCVAFDPGGERLASASEDRTVKVWDASTGRESFTLRGHSHVVTSVAFSPDGSRLISASGDRTVKVWDASTGREALTLKGHSDVVTGVAFGPDGSRIASSSWDRTVDVWDAATGQDAQTLKGHTHVVTGVTFGPGGRRLASAGGDRTVKVWEMPSGREVLTLKGHTLGPTGVAYSPDGRRLASTGDDRTVKVWDASTGREALTLKGGSAPALGVAYSPDGTRLAFASDGANVKVWDIATGREALLLKGHADKVWSVAFSPDGRRLASASVDRTVKVWDLSTGREALTLKGHASVVTGVAFSPDGKRLASASGDQMVKVWDAATGREALTLIGHTNGVTGVAYSPDGSRIASASDDRTVKLWDATTGQEALTLGEHTAPVLSVAFSPDGRRLASASEDRTVKVWDASPLRDDE